MTAPVSRPPAGWVSFACLILAIVLFAILAIGAKSLDPIEQSRLLAGGLVFFAAAHLPI